jgi:hypothetical protein
MNQSYGNEGVAVAGVLAVARAARRGRINVLSGGALLLVGAALAACAVDGTAGAGGEETGNTAAAISEGDGSWFGGNGNNHNFGDSSVQTCFLSGIQGEFSGATGYEGTFGHVPPVLSSTGLVPLTSPTGSPCTPGTAGCYWIAQNVNTSQSQGIGLDVACIYEKPTNICYATASSYNGGGNADGYCPSNANGSTRCFLTSVGTAGVFNSSSDYARIVPPSGSNTFFTLETKMTATGGTNDVDGYANMVCVDVPSIQGAWTFGFTGPSNGNDTASATTLLRNSYPSGAQVPVTNVACGLTGIAGDWMNNPDPLGWNDGVIANSPTGGFWSYTLTNGRTGDISCVK